MPTQTYTLHRRKKQTTAYHYQVYAQGVSNAGVNNHRSQCQTVSTFIFTAFYHYK